MKLKTIEHDGKTFAEVQDGKPVYVEDDGKETPFDAPGTRQTITRLNGEAMGHRQAKEAAEKALSAFEGIEDPAAALKALETIQNLDGGKLMDAEKATAERKAAVEAAVKDANERADKAEERASGAEKALHAEMIGGSFARSAYIKDKLVVPAPMVEKTFGDHFTIEDGSIVAKDASGNPIYSKAQPGELARFDEAMEIIVEQFAHKDSILKGRGANGSGAPGVGTGAGGGKTLTREAFNSLAPAERSEKMREGFTLTD